MDKDLTNNIGFIYKITTPDGRIYIGQTINFYERKRKYKSLAFKGQIKLWNYCNKYSWNPSTNIKIIEECLCGKNKLNINEREKYWINFYNSFLDGLICSIGGDGSIGRALSEETKEKLRQINLGKKHNKESIKKISNAFKGRKLSKETIDKIKETKKNNPYKISEETRKKISNNSLGNKKRLGKKHSEETKEKIRNSKLK